jgi:hypothetical protein
VEIINFSFNNIAVTFVPDLVSDFKSELIGNPVKIRSYPRSCKTPNPSRGFWFLTIKNHCSFMNGKDVRNGLSQKTCHIY